MSTWLKEVELEHDGIKLIPLRKSHKKGLLNAANDGKLWELWYTFIPNETTINEYVETALQNQKKNTALPFAIIDIKINKIIGTTRYMNSDEKNRRLEIGSTWYAAPYQRTKVNTICKLLLLQYAFEELGCIAVEFRTNRFNFKSREAILRLGAKQDGVLRSHSLDHNGLIRDTVVFSILNTEWPGVKKNLHFKMKQHKAT